MTLMNRPAGAPLTLLDGLICGYLVLPLLAFCTWFKWPVAMGLALLTGYGFMHALPVVQWRNIELSRRALALIAAVALAWTALAGIGHFFFANLDWSVRDAVLRDLVETPWPPMYETVDTLPVILRAPIGFYLPVAAVGAVLGLPCADILLYLWTALGFGLVLCAATTLFSTRRERVLCGALMLAFGGMDWVGFSMSRGEFPSLGKHLEWWALFAQYSSHSTLMFWVPNHALPAWLGLLLALRHWHTPALARMAPMLAAAITLWTPLSAPGLVPFFLIGLKWRRDLRALFSLRSLLPFIVLVSLVACYLTMDTQTIERGWAMDRFPNAGEFWNRYATFCMLEFGILALLLAGLSAFDLKVAVAVIVLLALPFFHFGLGSDLVMRGGIPALTVLALAAVRPLAMSDRMLSRTLLALVLAIGALGAMQEPARALLMPRGALTGQTLAQVSLGEHAPFGYTQLPAGYVGRLNLPGLQALMRRPGMVLPYHDAASQPRP